MKLTLDGMSAVSQIVLTLDENDYVMENAMHFALKLPQLTL